MLNIRLLIMLILLNIWLIMLILLLLDIWLVIIILIFVYKLILSNLARHSDFWF